MTTTPSEEVVPNYGKGLITYITADMGTEKIKSDNIPQAIEDLVRFPLGQQLYIRPTWREIQPRAGRLELPDYLKLVFDLAKKNNKRIGMRVQMNAPDYVHQPALPDFVLEKVPTVELIPDPKEASAAARFVQNPYARYQPRYDLTPQVRATVKSFWTMYSRQPERSWFGNPHQAIPGRR
jgi:hypothetical protein